MVKEKLGKLHNGTRGSHTPGRSLENKISHGENDDREVSHQHGVGRSSTSLDQLPPKLKSNSIATIMNIIKYQQISIYKRQ